MTTDASRGGDAATHRVAMTQATVEAAIAGLVAEHGPARSISPEDAARALAGDGDWHALLPVVRRAAIGMAADGRLDILRKGKPVDPTEVRGVIRLRAKPAP